MVGRAKKLPTNCFGLFSKLLKAIDDIMDVTLLKFHDISEQYSEGILV